MSQQITMFYQIIFFFANGGMSKKTFLQIVVWDDVFFLQIVLPDHILCKFTSAVNTCQKNWTLELCFQSFCNTSTGTVAPGMIFSLFVRQGVSLPATWSWKSTTVVVGQPD